ncbi:hypothetical protein AGMMS4952_05170 [Spirochaetia bacterium]|nr:hypothetical protein AGMMS4952_05170 [Spirochaetia bacterium]
MRFSGLAVLLFTAPALYGFNVSITGKEAGIELTPEYSRIYNGCLTFAGSGSLEFNERYTIRGGFAFWNAVADSAYEFDAATGLTVKLIRNLPLYIYVSYIFNTLPGYETNSHTILPLAAYRGKYAGLAMGTNLRFTSFFNEPAIFEPILALEAYVNFYHTEKLRIGLRGANFDDFTAGNFGAYYLSLNGSITITEAISLKTSVDVHQTGSVGLSAEFYRIACRMGVVCTW